MQPAPDDKLYGEVSEETKLLREDSRRASDQALTIKGFGIATAAVLVGFALSEPEVSANNRLALFCGLQLLQVVLSLMVRARRQQQAHLLAYETVFDSTPSTYEMRMKKLRQLQNGTISVDRWFAVSEGALVLILAAVGTVGTVSNLSGAEVPMQIFAVAINALALLVASIFALRRRTIGHLIEDCEREWLKLKNTEQ